jgi:hypothetical protein
MGEVCEPSKSNALLEIGEYWIEEYSKIEKECLFVRNELRVNTLSTDRITAYNEGRIAQVVRNETCSTKIIESRNFFAIRMKKKRGLKRAWSRA